MLVGWMEEPEKSAIQRLRTRSQRLQRWLHLTRFYTSESVPLVPEVAHPITSGHHMMAKIRLLTQSRAATFF